MNGNSLQFKLQIGANDYLRHYQGQACDVMAQSLNGIIISFKAVHLRQFIDHNGIHGLFEIEFDQKHKFIGIRKLSD